MNVEELSFILAPTDGIKVDFYNFFLFSKKGVCHTHRMLY